MAKRTYDISTTEGRAAAVRQFDWHDHDVLRRRWHNFEAVVPDVYRSNQPSYERFSAYADMGIKTVLNLRGALPEPYYMFEQEACAALGLELVSVRMSARNAPDRVVLLALMDAFEAMTGPFMIHCKSGADRTGLASALYLLRYTGASDEVARSHLSFRYLHIRKSSTGILDFVLEAYLARRKQSPIAVHDWLDQEYDKVALTADYKAMKSEEKLWEGW